MHLFRKGWLVGGMLIGLILLPIWSYLRLQSSQAAAEDAAMKFASCQRIAGTIQRLREQPARAGMEARSGNELSKNIEAEAKLANLPFSRVLRIDPQPARRIQNTAFLEQNTQVILELVTMQQLVTLISGLTASDPVLEVTALQLRDPEIDESPGPSNGSELWDAELTLTYLIFSPKST